MLVLPTEKIKSKVENPRFLIIYGKPKSGKTTLVAELEDNLIIDLEGGSEYMNALSIQARSVEDLGEIANAITAKIKETSKKPYKYITIDSATVLEEISKPLALKLYQQTPMGKLYKDDILKLPNGGGYYYLREAFDKIITMFKNLCETLILIGHCKDTLINKDGKEMSEMSLDLSGKLARITLASADAIGYCYRNKNKTMLNFKGGDDFILGARAPHLREQEFVIAESDEDHNITVFWDKIFLQE